MPLSEDLLNACNGETVSSVSLANLQTEMLVTVV